MFISNLINKFWGDKLTAGYLLFVFKCSHSNVTLTSQAIENDTKINCHE